MGRANVLTPEAFEYNNDLYVSGEILNYKNEPCIDFPSPQSALEHIQRYRALQELLERGDNATDQPVVGSTTTERHENIKQILDEQKMKYIQQYESEPDLSDQILLEVQAARNGPEEEAPDGLTINEQIEWLFNTDA